MPHTNRRAKRFPSVETVTVEWKEHHRPEEELAPEGGAFSYSIQASTGEVEPLLPCPNLVCHSGGFEILEVIESMVGNRRHEKTGLLVCIGWERAKGKHTEQSPCTRVIDYRIRLTYRKKSSMLHDLKG